MDLLRTPVTLLRNPQRASSQSLAGVVAADFVEREH